MTQETSAENVEVDHSIGSLLHSGEHLFARSLQNMGLDIHVRKADTFRQDGNGFLVIKEKIPTDKLFSAERSVNEVIPLNLIVETETLDDLEAAVSKYKNIRFNKERLNNTQLIRVIKIGNFDVSACKNPHVSNTSEISAFAIVNVSYQKGETTIEFKAGRDALLYLLSRNDALIELGKTYNFNPSDIDKIFENMQNSAVHGENAVETLFIKLLEQTSKDIIYTSSIDISKFYKAMHSYMGKNSSKCIVVVSDTQLFALRGKNNSFALQDIGRQLVENKAFIGEIREDYLNGKVIDYNKAVEMLSRLPERLG